MSTRGLFLRSRLALCGVRPHVRTPQCTGTAAAQGNCKALGRPATRDTESKQGWRRRSGQAEHQLGSHQLKATEAAGRGRWKTVVATPTRAQVHWQAVKSIPLKRMDGSPRRRKTRMGYCARTVTDVQPDIVLALGGWMSRMLQSERPDPALSAPGHGREKKKSSLVKHK